MRLFPNDFKGNPLELLKQDFLQTVCSVGMPRANVVRVHALKGFSLSCYYGIVCHAVMHGICIMSVTDI